MSTILAEPILRFSWIVGTVLMMLWTLADWPLAVAARGTDRGPGLRSVAWKLAVIVGLAYVLCLNGSYHFDDSHSIESNVAIRSLSNIPSFWADNKTSSFIPENRVYRPLVYTFYSFCYLLGGGATWPFHVMKMFMHLMVCLGLFAVWRRLWSLPGWFPGSAAGKDGFTLKFPFFSPVVRVTPAFAAFLLAATFAVHPTTSECVDYLSSTTSLQAAMFYIWGFWAWLMYRDHSVDRSRLLLALGFYFLSVASKEEGITLVAMIFIAELMLATGTARKRLESALRHAAPFAVLFVLMLVWYLKMRSTEGDESRGWVTPYQYFITQVWAWLHYMRIWFWPWDLNADSAIIEFSKSITDARVIQSIIGNVLLLGFAWVQRRRFPSLLFGLLWFYVTISPTSSVVVLAEAVNERRMYLPYLAFAGGTFSVILWCAEHAFAPDTRAQRLGWLYALIAFGLVTGTQERNWVWLDDENLWSDTVEKNPTSGRALNNLALVYLSRGDFQKSVSFLERCEQHWPTYMYCSLNKGIAFTALGKFDEAEKSYRRAYDLSPRNVHLNFHLGRFYAEARKDHAKAADFLKSAGDLQGGHYAAADISRASSLIELKNFDEAKVALQRAITAEPGNADALFTLGKLQLETHAFSDSVATYARLLDSSSRHLQGWYNFGLAKLELKDLEGARKAFERVVELDPRSEQGWYNLAFVAERMGDTPAALSAARSLAGVAPSNVKYVERLTALQKKFDSKGH